MADRTAHVTRRRATRPRSSTVTATSTFVPGRGITQMKLDVTGRVPDIDEAAFVEAAEGARDNCPVSGALKGNVEILLDARLAS